MKFKLFTLTLFFFMANAIAFDHPLVKDKFRSWCSPNWHLYEVKKDIVVETQYKTVKTMYRILDTKSGNCSANPSVKCFVSRLSLQNSSLDYVVRYTSTGIIDFITLNGNKELGHFDHSTDDCPDSPI